MSTVIRMVDDHTGVFSQLKLSDGNRVLISFTQTEVAIFKLAFFGNIPTTKIWSLPIKECLAFVSKSYGTAKPLGVITHKVKECYSLSELPLFLNKFFLVENNNKKENQPNESSIEKLLFQHTIEHSNGSVNTMFEVLEQSNILPKDISSKDEISYEYFFLFLYILENVLQDKLGQIGGRELADKILEVAIKSLSGVSEQDPETHRAEFMNNYIERMQKYSQYADFIAENPKGTLFWEFGKTVANIFGGTQDIRIVTLVQTSCINFLTNVNGIKLPK